jgi:predicted Zn-ribbon and HTH transcriptional regulator
MSFLVKSFNIQNKVVDTSFLATDHTFLPSSLGIRTQTLKLSFADPRTKASFLSPRISFQDAISRFGVSIHETERAISSGRFFDRNFIRDAVSNFGAPIQEAVSRFGESRDETESAVSSDFFLRTFIGDTVSIIYLPVYMKGSAVYDAILNRPIAKLDARDIDHFRTSDKQRNWKIHFIPAQCPDCGWDLTGGKQSISLLCKNCDTAWQVHKGKFKKLSYSAVPSGDKKVVFLPFWRMKVQMSGLNLHSYADLVRFANLPRAIKKEWEKIGIFFWAPAFKLQPRMFLRLAKQMTILQPHEEFKEEVPTSALHPVSLDSNDAFDSIMITLAHMTKRKNRIFPLLPHVKMSLKNARLVYFPFTLKGTDFIQTQMQFSIQRNALRT